MSLFDVKSKITNVQTTISRIDDPDIKKTLKRICEALTAIAKELDEHEDEIDRLRN